MTTNQQIVYTNKARCRDCYRCLRVCPVKAIRMVDSQASVVEERCINCGTCIRECPQHAKTYRKCLVEVQRMLDGSDKVAVSIAPSFSGCWEPEEANKIPFYLKQLGFNYIAETASAANAVADVTKTRFLTTDENIASSCPVVIEMILKYYPHLAKHIIKAESPMVAHARRLKKKLGNDWKVVFIGPCVGKKEEGKSSDYVDAVLSFEELAQWIESSNLEGPQQPLNPIEFFDEEPEVISRLFPLAGGMLKTAGLSTDLEELEVLAIDGPDEIKALLDDYEQLESHILIEPLFCSRGCINGPVSGSKVNVFQRQRRLLQYVNQPRTTSKSEFILDKTDISDIQFTPVDIKIGTVFDEKDVARVLADTGQSDEEDLINCGACGYDSCMARAVAVLHGMAEREMCIPYMRRLAEQRSDRIIETSPSGIIILDEHLKILKMNPAFQQFFLCSDAILGKRVSYLIDPEPFEQLITNGTSLEKTVHYKQYNKICRLLAYALPEDNQFIGIFVNVTEAESGQEKLRRIQHKTVKQAHELMEHQIALGQEMSKLLGANMAKGESLVNNLIELMDR